MGKKRPIPDIFKKAELTRPKDELYAGEMKGRKNNFQVTGVITSRE